ncbi:16S rRNA processing protein RimM [Paenibacillus shirakamiensis]|uniref:Ribosome maturation factor RimM n=1 Tax=Paenibacillus shirakamiensis TaxID=1265935 RepID=A0ABS4JHE6_9BACL|nr:ribosome maturation factor RimM [Paenibacillus shirakamiensis]MBP2001150.1 16S rRNA processing protein RimM [Paenibacillus shirakamiensis]
MSESLLTIGKIVNTHGIKGELKVLSSTDFPEIRFASNKELILVHVETGQQIKAVIEKARASKTTYIVKFKQFGNINEVEKYKGWDLKVPKDETIELPENEYFYHEIIGCKVLTDEGEDLGVISEILRPGANDVWVVKTPMRKEILLPVIDDVILDVDVKEKLIKVHIMEGLL